MPNQKHTSQFPKAQGGLKPKDVHFIITEYNRQTEILEAGTRDLGFSKPTQNDWFIMYYYILLMISFRLIEQLLQLSYESYVSYLNISGALYAFFRVIDKKQAGEKCYKVQKDNDDNYSHPEDT